MVYTDKKSAAGHNFQHQLLNWRC